MGCCSKAVCNNSTCWICVRQTKSEHWNIRNYDYTINSAPFLSSWFCLMLPLFSGFTRSTSWLTEYSLGYFGFQTRLAVNRFWVLGSFVDCFQTKQIFSDRICHLGLDLNYLEWRCDLTVCLFFTEINTFIQQGNIQLFKSDSKDIYNV